jgi:ribosomal protein S27E
MAIQEGIRCPECSRTVVPRLLFRGERNPIAYRKAQHICSYCGVVMYETGGGVNWAAVVILLVVFGACALVILMAVKSRR